MPQDPEIPETHGGPALTFLLVAAFFVSPLIFFTDLTRNPYYLQFTILNIALLAAGALLSAGAVMRGRWTPLPRNIAGVPLAALLAVMALSFVHAYFGHAPFFRPSMLSEFARTGMFTAVNCVLVFLIAQRAPFDAVPQRRSVYGWLGLIFLWGGAWLLFPTLKSPPSGSGLMASFWDPYGGFLWAAGIAWAWFLARRATQEDFLHLMMCVAGLASFYGAMQYFGIELIWPRLLNPYGNRSVSTFGNPNFISSHIVMLLPFVLAYLLAARKFSERLLYGFIFLSFEAMLMASLTRSSWIGGAAAAVFVFSFREYRARFMENRRFLKWFFSAAFLLLLLWPAQSLKPFSSGLADRLSEGAGKMASLSSLSLGADQEKVYSSFHQRLLIWTCAWQMGLESPLLGKGWGLFENFYPFYQGPLLLHFPHIRNLRTHANNAHNELLEMFSQTGLLGLGVYIWLFYVLFSAFRRYSSAAGPEGRYWTAPFAAATAGMFADNMFNVSLHFAVPAMLFWWLTGAFSMKLSPPRDPSPRKLGRPAAAAAGLLVLLSAAGAWYWAAQFRREMHYFRGFKAMRRNDYAGAAAELKKAYDSHGREVNNNYELANAYARLHDVPAAKWAYEEALKSNAGYDEIYFNLAIVRRQLGETDAALDDLKVSAFINPLNRSVYSALSESYIKEGEKAAAEGAAVFGNAARVFPEDPAILNTLGYFHTLKKDYASARDVYGRGVRSSPSSEALIRNLLGTAAQLGEKSDPDVLWLEKFQAVQKRLAAGDLSRAAIREADALVALGPENPNSLALRARLLFKAGDSEGAKRDLLKALKARPADNDMRYGLGVIYEREGDLPSARREWETILQTEPGNSAVAERLRRLPR